MAVYTVDYSCTAIVEAESEQEAKEKALLKEWKANMVDYYGMKATLQKTEPLPIWRGCSDGLKPVQTEKED